MALGFTAQRGLSYTIGNRKVRVYDVTGDTSYPTGGWAFTPGSVGLRFVDSIIGGHLRKTDGTAIVTLSYDRANNRLLAYSGGAQVANLTDLSLYVGRNSFIGY